jgi:hypothetical protein
VAVPVTEPIAQTAPLPAPSPVAPASATNVNLGNGQNITVRGSSAADSITLGNPTQSVIAGPGNNTINVPAELAGAKLIGHSQATTTLRITTNGNATLNDEDRDLTVQLPHGENKLALGASSDVTAQGTSGNDSITIGGLRQTVVAGSGHDQINASANLAGIKILGASQATTTLVITTGGNATLNDADSNITVVLGGSDPVSGGHSVHNAHYNHRKHTAAVIHTTAGIHTNKACK